MDQLFGFLQRTRKGLGHERPSHSAVSFKFSFLFCRFNCPALFRLYERALTAAGLDFRSDKLWEDYIAWETTGENYQNVLQIYDRLCKVPTLLYSTQFDRYLPNA